jgi:hypothetical protein
MTTVLTTRSRRRGGKDQPAQRGQVRRVGHPVDDTVAVWTKDREISRNVVCRRHAFFE